MNWRPFTLPATLPVTRIFSHYPTRTLPEVKKPYPSQPGWEGSVWTGAWRGLEECRGFWGKFLGLLSSRNLILNFLELWFGRQLCRCTRLQPGGLRGDELNESESFITVIVYLVSFYCQCLIRPRGESTRE